jgi:hypothetical protein
VLNGSQPEPIQIQTGISDGIFTEVISGLKEGQAVITAMTGGSDQSERRSNNPFGGGRRRF